jgi:osmotically-inducible protein OsmY
MKSFFRILARPVLWCLMLTALSGCFGVALLGVTTGVLVATDRRSVGAQTDDTAIELKAGSYLRQEIRDASHITITSYNRRVLLTGEVPTEAVKTEVGNEIAKVENVLGVWNELEVTANSSFATRANDSYITSKIRARFIDNGEFSPNHVKVVTENSVVFLLGVVNQREADRAIQIARTTDDSVRKVVNVLTIESDEEISRIDASFTGAADSK